MVILEPNEIIKLLFSIEELCKFSWFLVINESMFPNVHSSHKLTVERVNHCIWLFFSTLCVDMCNLNGEWNLAV